MNKKIIALAVAFAATSTSAATIYENDATTVGLKGEIDAYLGKVETTTVENGVTTNSETDPDIDLWAKIQVDAKHQLNEDVLVFGSFEMENGNSFLPGDNDSNEVKTDDLYIGAMYGDNFGFAVGEVGDFGDSMDAVTIDNTNEGVGYVDDEGTRFETHGHAISLKYSNENLVLIGDAYLNQDENIDTVYGISAEYNVAGFSLGASYQDHGNSTKYETTNDGDNSIVGVKLGYSNSDFSIKAHYVVDEIDSIDVDVYGLAADYKINDLRFYASGYTADVENSDIDIDAYTLGADYALSDNLTTFVEYSNTEGSRSSDKAEKDVMLAGVYYSF